MQQCSTFRWDLSRQEQLTRKAQATATWPFRGFLEDIRTCAAAIISMSQGADLVFVGRSPESLFDYISGAMEGTSYAARCRMLNVSMRSNNDSYQTLRYKDPVGLDNICAQFRKVGMSPQQITENPQPTALVDLVCEGFTLGELTDFLQDWAQAEQIAPEKLREKLRFVGILEAGKSSPKAWRWWQRQEWAHKFSTGTIKNISIDARFWRYMGNTQIKLVTTNPPCSWSYGGPKKKRYTTQLSEALKLARRIYDTANTRSERRLLLRELSAQHNIRQRWCRDIAAMLR